MHLDDMKNRMNSSLSSNLHEANSKRGNELNRYCPPSNSNNLFLLFCLYPSSMVAAFDKMKERETRMLRVTLPFWTKTTFWALLLEFEKRSSCMFSWLQHCLFSLRKATLYVTDGIREENDAINSHKHE